MKKLIIAVAALAMAVSANAAVTLWKTAAANVYDSTGTAKFTGDMYVFCAEMLAKDTLASTLASKTKISDVTSYLASNAENVGSISGGTAANTSAANQFSTAEDSLFVVGEGYNFYYAIVDGDKYLISDTKGPIQAQKSSAQNIAFGNQTAWTQTATNWHAVPEPTSGLLLLLGVAGLALKRRRA